MSSQKGNVSRTRPQKHKNSTSFKNNLHDTSNKTKTINSIQVGDVCTRCKEIIEWKIKYKKYKPLTQPKTCVKCLQKTVRQAYHVMCKECGTKLELCTKCCQKKDIVEAPPDQRQQLKLDNELKDLLQSLPERKRRTFLRYMNQKNKDLQDKESVTIQDEKDDLIDKLKKLKVDTEFDDEDNFTDDDDDDYE